MTLLCAWCSAVLWTDGTPGESHGCCAPCGERLLAEGAAMDEDARDLEDYLSELEWQESEVPW